jgi:hypothetical protein
MLSNLLHSQRFSFSAKARYWQSAPAHSQRALCAHSVPRIFRRNRVASSLFLRLSFYLNNKKQACSTPLFLISFCSNSQYNECTHFTPIGCAGRFLNRKTARATNVPNGFHNRPIIYVFICLCQVNKFHLSFTGFFAAVTK